MRYAGGLRPWCKPCYREYNQARKVRTLELSRRSRFGIGIDEQRELFAGQAGRCGACSEPIEYNAHLDHDHETGVVRSFLCHWCNQTIGQARESVERLAACAAYLQRHDAAIAWKEVA